jgi:uncharacterized OB-fold protein
MVRAEKEGASICPTHGSQEERWELSTNGVIGAISASRESTRSLSEEKELQALLKLLGKIKGSYDLDLESIHRVLKMGGKGAAECLYPLLCRLVGKESLDE